MINHAWNFKSENNAYNCSFYLFTIYYNIFFLEKLSVGLVVRKPQIFLIKLKRATIVFNSTELQFYRHVYFTVKEISRFKNVIYVQSINRM